MIQFINIFTHDENYFKWQTSTTGKGNFASLEDNGGLVVYDKNHKKLWSSLDIPFDISKSKSNIYIYYKNLNSKNKFN